MTKDLLLNELSVFDRFLMFLSKLNKKKEIKNEIQGNVKTKKKESI